MSGTLNLLLGGTSAFLPTTTLTMTQGSFSTPADFVYFNYDTKIYGYAYEYTVYDIGNLSPDKLGQYTVEQLYEYFQYSSNNGSYSGITDHVVYLSLTGPGSASLQKSSFTSLDMPRTATKLLTSNAQFSAGSSYTYWSWNLSPGDGTPDYVGNGSVIFET